MPVPDLLTGSPIAGIANCDSPEPADSSASTGSAGSVGAPGIASALGQPQDGIEFQVTKQIIGFLAKFSGGEAASGTVPPPSDSPSLEKEPEKVEPKEKKELTYHTFLDKLKQPRAADVVKRIKTFVINLQTGKLPGLNTTGRRLSEDDDDDDSMWSASNMPGASNPMAGIVRGFFKPDGSADEITRYVEGMRRGGVAQYIRGTRKVCPGKDTQQSVCGHERGQAAGSRDPAKDGNAAVSGKPKHLDIRNAAEEHEKDWDLAAGELRKMNSYKAPRDKVVCVLNACRVVTKLLTRAAGSSDLFPAQTNFCRHSYMPSSAPIPRTCTLTSST